MLSDRLEEVVNFMQVLTIEDATEHQPPQPKKLN